MNRSRRLLTVKLIVATGSVLVALLLGEFGMRLVMCREAGVDSFTLVRDRYLGKQLAIFGDPAKFDPCTALVPGSNIGSTISINAFGLRGAPVERDKRPGVLRAICFGGSSVFGTGSTSDATTWPALLGTHCTVANASKPVEVLNAGVPGFTSVKSVERFAVCCRRFKPDVVILCNEINDILTRRISRLTYDPRNDAPVSQDSALERVLSHSAIYLRARAGVRYASKQEKVAAVIADAESPAKKSAIVDGLDREREAGRSSYIQPGDLEDYRVILHRFIATAKEGNATPVLSSEPLAFAIHSDEATFRRDGGVLSFYFPDHGRFVELIAAYHESIRSVAKESGAIFLDGDSLVPHEAKYWVDFVHTNDMGAEKMARSVCSTLVESKVLPKP